ncbi:MAG: hypothetical protein JNM69_26325 [Archangium sp.]|nr:hypothetical protein [Archangium sp.]
MDKKKITEARSIISKLPTHLERSGGISSQLRTVEDGAELYDAVQKSELDLRTAREKAEGVVAEYVKESQQLDASEKKLLGLIRVGAEVCTLFGVQIANDVLKADDADPQASSAHIAHYLTRVPGFGKALGEGLMQQRAQFIEAEKAIKSVEAHTEAGTRELNGAYYRAVSVVAQAKAFLAVKGVVVRDRKASVRKPRALTGTAANTQTERAASPNVPAAPAPTPNLVPEAA